MLVAVRSLTIASLLATSALALAQGDYVNHVVFTNSTTADNDFDTSGQAVAPSTLAAPDGRLPVDTRTFLSPPNALRLEWRSAPGGAWDAEVRPMSVDMRPSDFLGTTLSFWLYAPQPVAAADLPRMQLTDSGGFTAPLELAAFAGSLPAGRWTQVRIPLHSFVTASARPFDARRLHSIHFMQGAADNQPHTLLVDEIRIGADVPAAPGQPSSLAAPHGLAVKAYERHVDLSWEPNDNANLAYTIVYRSRDGGPFEPVGVQQPGLYRFMDWVGAPGLKLSYKIAAVDDAYRQSAFSATTAAQTRTMTDEELMTMVQEECFRYYWEQGSHPQAGMALESVPGDPRIVATGASGFGIMAIVAGMDRGFITREQGMERLTRIVGFLEKADRFHGAWAHFMDGSTGKAMPVFGRFDDGGDLVETSFLVQGLLVARQYANPQNPSERDLAQRITHLWETVEWDWYAREFNGDALLWHWSPVWSWQQHHKLTGFNETMIAYLLGIASPTHAIPAAAYYEGWASQSQFAAEYRSGWSGNKEGSLYSNGTTYEGIKLDVGVGSGGPLFFTQYSFMGADPHKIRDRYTNYFDNNRNLALIDYRYCVRNPGHYKGYSPDVWGLTASLDPNGYAAHAPNAQADDGTIAPTAALGAFPYTPQESMAALRYFYRNLGDRLWGIYGPTDAFSLGSNWFATSYLGLDQAPITVMIENHRSGLIWKLFMANPEMAPMLARIAPQPAQGEQHQ